ncbi:MAG TPA: acyltransferase [Blastocatellia bacterium]
MRRVTTTLAGWLVKLTSRAVLHSAARPSVRAKLGRVFSVMRDCAFENESRRVRARYDIHSTVKWVHDTLLSGEGQIAIGEGTYIGRDSFIMSQPASAKIGIGRFCAISHNVHIRTASYRTDGDFDYRAEDALTWADVTVGDRVWLGAHVVVTGGVTIGNNSVIGANSVVTRDVPPNSIYAGVPARLIRYKDETSPMDNAVCVTSEVETVS